MGGNALFSRLFGEGVKVKVRFWKLLRAHARAQEGTNARTSERRGTNARGQKGACKAHTYSESGGIRGGVVAPWSGRRSLGGPGGAYTLLYI